MRIRRRRGDGQQGQHPSRRHRVRLGPWQRHGRTRRRRHREGRREPDHEADVSPQPRPCAPARPPAGRPPGDRPNATPPTRQVEQFRRRTHPAKFHQLDQPNAGLGLHLDGGDPAVDPSACERDPNHRPHDDPLRPSVGLPGCRHDIVERSIDADDVGSTHDPPLRAGRLDADGADGSSPSSSRPWSDSLRGPEPT